MIYKTAPAPTRAGLRGLGRLADGPPPGADDLFYKAMRASGLTGANADPIAGGLWASTHNPKQVPGLPAGVYYSVEGLNYMRDSVPAYRGWLDSPTITDTDKFVALNAPRTIYGFQNVTSDLTKSFFDWAADPRQGQRRGWLIAAVNEFINSGGRRDGPYMAAVKKDVHNWNEKKDSGGGPLDFVYQATIGIPLAIVTAPVAMISPGAGDKIDSALNISDTARTVGNVAVVGGAVVGAGLLLAPAVGIGGAATPISSSAAVPIASTEAILDTTPASVAAFGGGAVAPSAAATAVGTSGTVAAAIAAGRDLAVSGAKAVAGAAATEAGQKIAQAVAPSPPAILPQTDTAPTAVGFPNGDRGAYIAAAKQAALSPVGALVLSGALFAALAYAFKGDS